MPQRLLQLAEQPPVEHRANARADTTTTLVTTAVGGVREQVRRATRAQSACAVVLSGLRFGELLRMGNSTSLGREGCDHCFPDPGVSRRHARITRSGDTYQLDDLGSANGTWVNGCRVESTVTLTPGDKIHLGPATLVRFALHDHFDDAFQDQLSGAALRDPLTHLFNRRYLERRLLAELAFAQRHAEPLSLLVVDIDDLHLYNARLGHELGDEILVGIGRLVERIVRTEDVVARIDNDELAILCRNTRRSGARTLAERLRLIVRHHPLRTSRGVQNLTVSIGLATYPDVDTLDPARMLRAADAALFLARRSGPDGIAAHAPARL